MKLGGQLPVIGPRTLGKISPIDPAATHVQCVWFLGNCIFWTLLLSTDKKNIDVKLIKNVGPVFYQIFNRDVFGWFTCGN